MDNIYEQIMQLTSNLSMGDRLTLNAAIITLHDAVKGRFGEETRQAVLKLCGTVPAANILTWNVPE